MAVVEQILGVHKLLPRSARVHLCYMCKFECASNFSKILRGVHIFSGLFLFTSILHLREIHDLELNYAYLPLPSVAVIHIPKDLASKEII